MDTSLFLMAGGSVIAAAIHAWVGTRYFLPRLFRLPAFGEMLSPTGWVRRACVGAWLLGSVGILAFAALIPLVDALQSRGRVQVVVFALLIVFSASPMILGTYLGLLLRSRTQHVGMWFSIVIWAVLATVIAAAWQAAGAESPAGSARPNNEMQRTKLAQAMALRR